MILASVITYALAKRIGAAEAEVEFSRQCNALSDGPEDLGAARTIRKLRRFGDVAKLHDAGGTSIGHARSRAFSVALRAAQADKLSLWISIDDDVEASDETLSHLVGSMDPDTPQIVIVPCRLRQERPVLNITLDPESSLERVSKTGARLRRALFGGFGVVAMTKAAVLEVARCWQHLTYVDDDNQVRFGVFCEYISRGCWYRDDYAFFSRVPPHIRTEVLCTGVTDHGGYKLRLEKLDDYPHIPLPPGWTRAGQSAPALPSRLVCSVCRAELALTPDGTPYCAACSYVVPLDRGVTSGAELNRPGSEPPTPREGLGNLETACRQEGGFISPRLGHVRGLCCFRLGHDGRHSWEPESADDETDEAERLDRFKQFG